MKRREFVLAGAALSFSRWAAGADSAATGSASGGDTAPSAAFLKPADPIRRAADVLNVRDFEPLAQRNIPPAHFGYLATGVDDDRTLRRNEQAYGDYEIRARRFVDVSRLDTSVTVFGTHWPLPVYLSAVSAMRAFHPEAEPAVARAARTRSVQQMVSNGASAALAEILAARAAPVWQQLYATDDWKVAEGVVQRAEAAGADAIVLTVDGKATIETRNSETMKRMMRVDSRSCTNCHVNNDHNLWRKAPLYAGLDVSRVQQLAPRDLTPEWLDRLRKLVRGKLIVKGIVTGEDADLAVARGADAVVVSNHGGRNEETLRASIDCVAEVVAAVRGRAPVLVDGGIRRGTDVFKALALGATAVGIGRPQAWGLGAFGQEGVEAVLDIYARELKGIMLQAGTPTIASITQRAVIHRSGA